MPYGSELEVYEAACDGSLGFDLAPHEWWGPRPRSTPSYVVTALERRFARAGRLAWWNLWSRPESEPYRVTVALLEAFHAEARAGGARLAGVLLFPARSDVELGRRPLLHAARELERRGVPFLDLDPVVRPHGRAGFGDAHLTPALDDEVAGAVLAWLREQL